MSGAAGGGVELVVGAAVVVPILAVAGLAVGVAVTTRAIDHALDEAWERREETRRLRRMERELAEQRLRAFEEARSGYTRVRDLIAADVAAGHTEIPVPPPPPDLPDDADLASRQETVADLRIRTAQLVAQQKTASRTRSARGLLSALQSTVGADAVDAAADLAQRSQRLAAEHARAVAAGDAVARESAEAAVAQVRADRLALADRAERDRVRQLLAEVPSTMSTADADVLEEWVARLPGLSGDELSNAVAVLESLVARATADAVERTLQVQLASAVLTALDGCTSPAAQVIRQRAQGCLDGMVAWDPLLPDQARIELERVQQELSDLAATVLLGKALSDLGYDVGEGFAVAALDEVTYVHRPDWPDHAVSVSYDTARDEVHMAVVRDGTGERSALQQLDDVAHEQQFCASLDRIESAALERGLRVELHYRVDPGAEAVERVADTGRASAAEEQVRPREREL